MKKIILLVTTLLLSVIAVPTQAATTDKTIAIIDYTFDTTRPELSGKMLADVCMSITKICTNMPTSNLYANQTAAHGTIMATVASQVSPNLKFIIIRIGNINPKTFSLSSMGPTEFDNVLIASFNWVAANAKQYNIVAISTSMSHTSFNTTGSYCPIKKSATYNTTLQNKVIELQSIGIASIFSAGNTYDDLRASYPACIPQSIAIGATELTEPSGINPVSLKSAKGPDVDFYALGTYTLSFTRMTGQTSPAAVAFATYWTRQYVTNYSDTYNKIVSFAKPVYFSQTQTYTNQFIDVLK